MRKYQLSQLVKTENTSLMIVTAVKVARRVTNTPISITSEVF